MNEYTPLLRINWRTSLVPEAKVIPAPIVYIKVVADKKAPRLRPDAAERGPAGRRWRAREASSGASLARMAPRLSPAEETDAEERGAARAGLHTGRRHRALTVVTHVGRNYLVSGHSPYFLCFGINSQNREVTFMKGK